VSTDLHTLAAYRDQYDLPFALVGDPAHRARAYDAIESFEHYGVDTVARRAVFVIDGDGVVTYRWLADNRTGARLRRTRRGSRRREPLTSSPR